MTTYELQFANNATTTIAFPISNTATSVTLASATGFPSLATGQAFLMTFNDAATGLLVEIVLCTAISGTTCTIVRGQEGTTARGWLANDLVAMKPTAGTMAAFAQPNDLQSQSGNYAQDTGTVNALVVTLTPTQPLSALIGSSFRVNVANANTGPATMFLNGIASLPIIAPGGTAATLQSGQISTGVNTFTYDGSSVVIQSGGAVSLGTAAYKAASNNSAAAVSSVVGAVATGHVPVFADANGSIKDGGTLGSAAFSAASSSTASVVASVYGTAIIGNTPTYTDTVGTIGPGVTPTAAATNAQMEAGNTATVYSPPSNVWRHPAFPKAWVQFQGRGTNGTCTIIGSFNVASVTRTGSGNYTVQTANIVLSNGFAVPTNDTSVDDYGKGASASGTNPSFAIEFSNRGGGASLDPSYAFVTVWGNATN